MSDSGTLTIMPVPIDEALEPGLPPASAPTPPQRPETAASPIRETGGPAHPDPTRYGDWELRGRCIDF
jgi:hypothetical protein